MTNNIPSTIQGVEILGEAIKNGSLFVTAEKEVRTEILKELAQEFKENKDYKVIYISLNKYLSYIDDLGIKVLKKALISECAKLLSGEKQELIQEDISQDKHDLIIKRVLYNLKTQYGARPVIILDNFDDFSERMAKSNRSDEEKESY